MTEKRYYAIEMEGKIYPIYFDGDKELDEKEVCDLLNELYDENKQLKERNQELYDKLQETMSLSSSSMVEVELIKRIMREAYETERTQIGKNVLKQLMEAIE